MNAYEVMARVAVDVTALRRLCWQLMPVLNLVVAVLCGSIGRVIAVLCERLLLLSLLVERFVLTLINEDYYYLLLG